MIRNLSRYFALLCLIACLKPALAQESGDLLSGYWKQEADSVYIKVVNSNGVYEAEMIRNDWAPALVGTMYLQNVVPVEGRDNRWIGESSIKDSDDVARATLRVNRSGVLSTRLRPGGRARWLRTDPIEKRF